MLRLPLKGFLAESLAASPLNFPRPAPSAVGVRYWSGVFDPGQSIARDIGFEGRISAIGQSRKPKKLND
jgi:hypothetical protein